MSIYPNGHTAPNQRCCSARHHLTPEEMSGFKEPCVPEEQADGGRAGWGNHVELQDGLLLGLMGDSYQHYQSSNPDFQTSNPDYQSFSSGHRTLPHRTLPRRTLPTGHCPTGHCPTERCPTGRRPTGRRPTGHYPTGRCPTGRCPTGRCPTGRRPTGRCPTGRRLTGRRPTGRRPTGRRPTGRRPTGRRPQDTVGWIVLDADPGYQDSEPGPDYLDLVDYGTRRSRAGSSRHRGGEVVTELGPEEVRWCYKEDKRTWKPFVGHDSLEIEVAYRKLCELNPSQAAEQEEWEELGAEPEGAERQPGASVSKEAEETGVDSISVGVEAVCVRGGLYEVDVKEKECYPVYWNRKCTCSCPERRGEGQSFTRQCGDAMISKMYWARTGLLLGSYWTLTGLVLDSYWTRTGLVLGSYWARTGLVLFSYWTRTGLVLDSYWTRTGLLLDSYWARTGLVLDSYWARTGLLLDSYWARTGLLLDSYWTRTGLLLDSYCSRTGLVLDCRQHEHVPGTPSRTADRTTVRTALFWSVTEQERIPVMRGQWFTDGTWLPLEEEDSDLIELEHLACFRGHQMKDTFETEAVTTAVDSKDAVHSLKLSRSHVDWHSVDEVYLYSDATTSKIARTVTQKLGFSKASSSGTRLHRGYVEEAAPEDTPPAATHIVFVIHGIGQKMDQGRIIRNTSMMRDAARKMEEKHFSDRTTEHVEFLPVEWRSKLSLDGDTVDSITPDKVRGLRDMLNSSAMDIMYYTSPLYRDEITRGLTKELNRLYTLFCSRNPEFEEKGKVSIVSHSLGCVITFDIMTGWDPIRFHHLEAPDAMETELRRRGCEEQRLLEEVYHTRRRLRDLEDQLQGLKTSSSRTSPPLKFKVENFFCMGSPLAVFLALRGVRPGTNGTQDHILPRSICQRLFNIFHPTDPVAYRLEPLILKHYSNVSPVQIHWYVPSASHETGNIGMTVGARRMGHSVSEVTGSSESRYQESQADGGVQVWCRPYEAPDPSSSLCRLVVAPYWCGVSSHGLGPLVHLNTSLTSATRTPTVMGYCIIPIPRKGLAARSPGVEWRYNTSSPTPYDQIRPTLLNPLKESASVSDSESLPSPCTSPPQNRRHYGESITSLGKASIMGAASIGKGIGGILFSRFSRSSGQVGGAEEEPLDSEGGVSEMEGMATVEEGGDAEAEEKMEEKEEEKREGDAAGMSQSTSVIMDSSTCSAPKREAVGSLRSWLGTLLMHCTRHVSGDSAASVELDRRVDFELREGLVESRYWSAVTSHTAYWCSHDIALFLLTFMYGPNGTSANASVDDHPES
ncbi:hypothetical protein NFI96_022331 [Prochilodus magdalenae]|nr:hypothetical protein NFI96_022331 [Prochilodus magdalenae]